MPISAGGTLLDCYSRKATEYTFKYLINKNRFINSSYNNSTLQSSLQDTAVVKHITYLSVYTLSDIVESILIRHSFHRVVHSLQSFGTVTLHSYLSVPFQTITTKIQTNAIIRNAMTNTEPLVMLMHTSTHNTLSVIDNPRNSPADHLQRRGKQHFHLLYLDYG